MNKRTLLAGLVGFIVSFLMGWLTYGMLFKDVYTAGTMAGVNRPETEMIWWAMLLGNLAWIVLLVYLLERTGSRSISQGAMLGLLIGALFSLSIDLYFYAGTNMFIGRRIICVDILNSMVTNAVVGGVIGWMLGKGRATAPAMS